MSNLAKEISMACSALGLRVELGFKLSLDGSEIQTVALIPELGFSNGMLIVTSIDTFRGRSNQLANAGYGASVIGELSGNHEFDLDGWREVFIDWGWGRDPASKPTWMTEPPLDELRDILLNSPNDATREDAARKISLIHWEDDRSQELLFDRITSGLLDSDLQLACVESLASLWIRRGKIDRGLYDKLANEDLRQILAPWFKELEN